MNEPAPTVAPTAPRRLLGVRLPPEGESGLFSQSWFPICMSKDVARGQVKGYDFLDGRVIVMRGDDGVARVMSAFCPHLGADLSVGQVIGDTVRCAFHHWQYDGAGRCVRTAVGDPAPPTARLFRFPTTERYGIVFAFNGDEPLFELPTFAYPEDQLLVHAECYPTDFPVDPWVICCNTPDVQHIRVLHNITFDAEDPGEHAEWTEHSMLYDFTGTHALGERIDFRVGIYGTSIFYQSGKMQGRWFGFMSPMGMPRPQRTRGYLVLAVRKDEPDAQQFLQAVVDLERRVVGEDIPVLETIHFRPGTLSASDKTLARFLNHLKRYPRAHPAAEFIR